MTGFFVTGTDTGVGKTAVSCGLLRALARAGIRAVGMKPVAAGCTATADGWRSDDAEQLRAASSVAAPRELVNPYALEAPIAPHIAARRAGVVVDLSRIEAAYRELAERADVVVVEGVGGFRVPLNDAEDSADLARRLDLPVILVVGLRLGCLNHAQLTADAIAAAGLSLAGWVANRIDPRMDASDDNRDALARRLPGPLLGDVPFDPAGTADSIALHLRLAPLAGRLPEAAL